MQSTSTRVDVLAVGFAAVLGALLAVLAILQCGAATAAGADRVASSPQLDPSGARVLAALADPMVTRLGSISLAVAVVGYAVLGALVALRRGSVGRAALLAGVSFVAGSVVAVLVEQVLYPTASYYFTAAGTVAYYVVNLAYVLSVVVSAVAAVLAAGGAAVTRRLSARAHLSGDSASVAHPADGRGRRG